MKLMRAYVRHFKASEVIDILRALKAPRVTVINIMAVGDEVADSTHHLSAALVVTYTNMVKIELICNDDCVERVKETLISVARTGFKGDGIVAISPMEEAISIRTGKRAIRG